MTGVGVGVGVKNVAGSDSGPRLLAIEVMFGTRSIFFLLSCHYLPRHYLPALSAHMRPDTRDGSQSSVAVRQTPTPPTALRRERRKHHLVETRNSRQCIVTRFDAGAAVSREAVPFSPHITLQRRGGALPVAREAEGFVIVILERSMSRPSLADPAVGLETPATGHQIP